MRPFYPHIRLSDEDCDTLLRWVFDERNADCFLDAMMGGKRATTRLSKSGAIHFPATAFRLRKQIAESLMFPDLPLPGFSYGMAASYAFPGDTCFSHTDPRWHDGLWTVHCNVILSAPEAGGELIVDGVPHEMPVGQPICYPVSEVVHETLEIRGNKPRIMWVFGYCVTPDVYESSRKSAR